MRLNKFFKLRDYLHADRAMRRDQRLFRSASCWWTTIGMVIPERSAVIFFVDGVDHTCFDNMLAAGDLPNIEKRFVRGGVTVKNGITSLPSYDLRQFDNDHYRSFPGPSRNNRLPVVRSGKPGIS